MEIRAAILILLFSAVLCVSGGEGFVRYQSILDKRPFGQEIPADGVIEIAASESFAQNMRLSMLVRGSDGCFLAGVIDRDSGQSYVLKLREPQNGVELIFADMGNSEAMIRNGSEIVRFKLEADKTGAVFWNSAQLVQEVRVRELSCPIRVEAPEPNPSGSAFQKYLQSSQDDSGR